MMSGDFFFFDKGPLHISITVLIPVKEEIIG